MWISTRTLTPSPGRGVLTLAHPRPPKYPAEWTISSVSLKIPLVWELVQLQSATNFGLEANVVVPYS